MGLADKLINIRVDECIDESISLMDKNGGTERKFKIDRESLGIIRMTKQHQTRFLGYCRFRKIPATYSAIDGNFYLDINLNTVALNLSQAQRIGDVIKRMRSLNECG